MKSKRQVPAKHDRWLIAALESTKRNLRNHAHARYVTEPLGCDVTEPLENTMPAKREEPMITQKELVRAMIETNATDLEVADYLDMDLNTLRKHHGEVLRTSRRDLCRELGAQLKNIASGYRKLRNPETGEIHVEMVDPKVQTQSAQYYLNTVGKWVMSGAVEVSGPAGGPIVSATLGTMSDDQVAALLAALAARQTVPAE